MEKSTTNCPICGSFEIAIFHDKVWKSEGQKVVRCGHCDVTFLNPMMDEERERDFYENYNAHVRARGVTVTEEPDEFHRESRAVVAERLKVVGRFFSPGMRVLEIGSSTGAFAEAIPDCSCTCVEPSVANREFSRRFADEVYGDMSEIPRSKTFDVICMFHVFEHFRRPLEILASCKTMLGFGGHIVVEVPSMHDPLLTLFDLEEFKDFYFQPMHPFVYSERALSYVFAEAGFREIATIHHQRYGLDNHLNWLINRKPGLDEELRSLFGDLDGYKRRLAERRRADTLYFVGAHRLD